MWNDDSLWTPPNPPPCSNLPAGWRNVYWLELKKKLVVSIIVCKHRLLKASSELSSPATHMLYIQFALENRLGEYGVYNSRVTPLMGGLSAWGSPDRHYSQLSGGLWCLLNQKHQERSQGQLSLKKFLPGAYSGPLPPHYPQKCFVVLWLFLYLSLSFHRKKMLFSFQFQGHCNTVVLDPRLT